MKLTAPQLRVLRLMRDANMSCPRWTAGYCIGNERIASVTQLALRRKGLIERADTTHGVLVYKLTALGREAAGEGS